MTLGRKATAVLATAVAALGLAGCGGISAGTVTAKSYEASYTSYSTTMAGKVPITMPITQPECFRLDLRNEDGETGHVCVTAASWDSTNVGDFVNVE